MEVPKRELSYRYYNKLSSKDKAIIDNSDLTPVRRLLAMYFYRKNDISLNKAIRISRKYSVSNISFKNDELLKYVISEFRFRGFIPLSEYKRFNPKYPHITTNFKIDGDFWIYPKRFGSTEKHLLKGYPLIERVFPEYGIQGYTRILYGTD